MNEIFYKPLTPDFREQINDSISKNIAELKNCEPNALVNMQLCGQKALQNIINSLPDGYLLPMERR